MTHGRLQERTEQPGHLYLDAFSLHSSHTLGFGFAVPASSMGLLSHALTNTRVLGKDQHSRVYEVDPHDVVSLDIDFDLLYPTSVERESARSEMKDLDCPPSHPIYFSFSFIFVVTVKLRLRTEMPILSMVFRR